MRDWPRIHIFYEFQDGPFGGGNQFLKALADFLRDAGRYAVCPNDADVILFNSHRRSASDRFRGIADLKRRRPDLLVVHRVDGPMALIRGNSPFLDRTLFLFNQLYADGTVFQSDWSRRQCEKLGLRVDRPARTILNAPDRTLAYDHGRATVPVDRRTRLVAASWSPNMSKGFADYRWLDENLDFSRFEMRFIGQSPIAFRNISHIPPLTTAELTAQYRESDIFITASRNDPCSNALIEALHCGLPAIAKRDGGHPEIIGKGGALFDDVRQVPTLLEEISARYAIYREAIRAPSLDVVGNAYMQFFDELWQRAAAGTLQSKHPHFYDRLHMDLRDKLDNRRALGRSARSLASRLLRASRTTA